MFKRLVGTKRLTLAIVAAVFAVACEAWRSSSPASHQGAAYEIVATGISSNGFTLGDFNDRGDLVGTRTLPDSSTRVIRWTDGVTDTLMAPAGETRASTVAMNESGAIVGKGALPGSFIRWSKGSALPTVQVVPDKVISGYGTFKFVAAGITDSGAVLLGNSANSSVVPIHWWRSDSLESIPGTAGWSPITSGSGDVIYMTKPNAGSGTSWRRPPAQPERTHGCPWNHPLYYFDTPYRIANSGAVLGKSGSWCVWKTGDSTAVFTDVVPVDLNAFGFVIGNDSTVNALVYGSSAKGPWHDINGLFAGDADRHGWVITSLLRVNDLNQIVAIGTKDGKAEVIVLKPKP